MIRGVWRAWDGAGASKAVRRGEPVPARPEGVAIPKTRGRAIEGQA